MQRTGVGIVGCGNISGIYLQNLTTVFNKGINILAVSDLIESRAQDAAEKYNIPKVCTTEEMMEDPSIELILNITEPYNHFKVSKQALNAGKHVYTEKPLSATFAEGKELVELAKSKGLRIGGAPDTYLGAGIQTCIQLINDGEIGIPVAATAFMLGHGHESWHPDPEFYYEPGAGPMLDMGPYYTTALVALLGAAKKVTGITKITFPERTITSEKKCGKVINVKVPTHNVGVIETCSGAIVNIITSFDVWAHSLPNIEIYGSEGSLRVPDPNTFGGPVYIKKSADTDWTEIPVERPFMDNSRGLGLADMAQAIRENRVQRSGSELLLHALEIMESINSASELERHITLETTCERPQQMESDYSRVTL